MGDKNMDETKKEKNDIDAILAVLNPILMICFSVSQMANILTTAFKEKLTKEVNDEIKKMEEK